MNLGRVYFEQLQAAEFTLENLLGRVEDNWLDFKESVSQTGEPTIDDLDNLAKALSGFGNSDGGVIVWGVRCKQVAGDDVADSVTGIADAEKFLRRLDAAATTLTDPPVTGFKQIILPHADSPQRGLIASFIPATESGLYRANRKNMHSFFYRAGSQFPLMPTYMVAEKFGRRPPPRLSPFATILQSGPGSNGPSYRVSFFIENTGTVCAFKPAMRIQLSRGIPGMSWSYGPTKPFQRRDSILAKPHSIFFYGADEVIYPGGSIEVTDLRFHVLYAQKGVFLDLMIDIDVYQDGPSCRATLCLKEVELASCNGERTSLQTDA